MMKFNSKTIGYVIFIIAMLLFPALADSKWLAIGSTFLIFSVVGLSEDIILGKGGMFNMGHALFFGIGAYTAAIANKSFGIPILYSIPLAIIIPALCGIVLAGPIIHLRGDYLLVATIGFNIVFLQLVENNIFGITGGPNGIFGLDTPSFLGMDLASPTAIYYLGVGVLILTFFIMANLDRSKAGRALHYLRLDELAANSIGINTRGYKLFAFGLGAGIAGLAGVLLAIQYSAVSPEAFNFMQSVLFFSIVLVGGSSLPGILMGTFVMFVLPEIFRDFATWRYFIFGFAMIFAMILRPEGIFPARFGKIPEYFKRG
ncbi:LivM2 [Desulforapulum autotrophicum HRM2]|uniref:LivM2 n=1 Tax=Desulforapulum autotrophicum (strain ATCC 43914 / DSM 3382 / VKM B-1955 / HRM2) TaxID=177437 RepID=C0QHP9_DESAH|nr:branched-chain amino acid ABC transporter permease [Desulforapulum autotrophicum]ACN13607.1 LivM2 [Desulforapulum autotrophicum HRM2]